MKLDFSRFSSCLITVILINSVSGLTQPVLDNTFNNTGLIRKSLGTHSISNDITFTRDNKILLLGSSGVFPSSDMVVMRFFPDGRIDSAFAQNGIRIIDFGSYDIACSIGVLSSDKIVVAGTTGNKNVCLALLDTNGNFDPAFGNAGKVSSLVPPDTYESVSDLVIQSDDKILISGRSVITSDDFLVRRYLPDGNPDNSFSLNGRAVIPIGNSNDYGLSIALQADKRIVVAGRSVQNGTHATFLRLKENGSIDSTFSGDGKLVLNLGSNSRIDAVQVQPDGKIIGCGSVLTAPLNSLIMRLNPDGSLDPTFNNTGYKTLSLPNSNEIVSLCLQPDNKLVAAGYINNGNDDDVFMIRFNSDGTLDNGFGIISGNYYSLAEGARAIKLNSLNEIFVAGRTSFTASDLLVAKYKSDQVTLINDRFQNNKITAFPNPISSDELYILGSENFKAFSAELYDINGALLQSYELTSIKSGLIPINLPALSKGIYLLKVKGDGEVSINKIIRQ
jgi:uncharacterized delta-60 repeat protein